MLSAMTAFRIVVEYRHSVAVETVSIGNVGTELLDCWHFRLGSSKGKITASNLRGFQAIAQTCLESSQITGGRRPNAQPCQGDAM